MPRSRRWVGLAGTSGRHGEHAFAEYCADDPTRFAAFGVLPLPHVDASLAELERCLDTLGMVGINLGCSIAGRQIDDPALEPIFAELDRRGTTVFFHPIGDLLPGDLGAAYGLDWLVGAPFEDTLTALRLVLSGLSDRYSNAKYVIPHLGGTIPFLFARIHRRSPDLAASLGKLYYDTVSHATPALACTCEAVGPSRLLYGTDYPYGREELFFRCLDYLGDVGLDEDTLAGVRGGTAAELLGIRTAAHPR